MAEGFKRIVKNISSLDGIIKDDKVELVGLNGEDQVLTYGVVIDNLKNMLFVTVRQPRSDANLHGYQITENGLTKVLDAEYNDKRLSKEARIFYEYKLSRAGL